MLESRRVYVWFERKLDISCAKGKFMKFKGTILCFVLISVLFLCGCQTTDNQKSTEQVLIKWEYAQLQHALCNGNSGQVSRTTEGWLWLTSSGEQKYARTLSNMYYELTGRSQGNRNVSVLLGAIGEDGWELAECSQGSRKLDDTMRNLLRIRSSLVICQTETWIFKRPKD
jgi:hypothetical protein